MVVMCWCGLSLWLVWRALRSCSVKNSFDVAGGKGRGLASRPSVSLRASRLSSPSHLAPLHLHVQSYMYVFTETR